jgi:hypothetical protein
MIRYKGRQSAKAKTLSANRLRKLLKYDPATGVFRWRARKVLATSALLQGAFIRQKVAARSAWTERFTEQTGSRGFT